jgi:hypothetical protein
VFRNLMVGNWRLERAIKSLSHAEEPSLADRTSDRFSRRASISRVVLGVAHGLAQMGTLGHAAAVERFPANTPQGALRGDWNRVGGDMQRAMSHETKRVKEGA